MHAEPIHASKILSPSLIGFGPATARSVPVTTDLAAPMDPTTMGDSSHNSRRSDYHACRFSHHGHRHPSHREEPPWSCCLPHVPKREGERDACA